MESVGSVSFGGQNSGFQIGTNNAPITAQINPPDLDHILPMVHGAAFDSYSDQHENECLPGTRTDILRQINEWAFSPFSRCIFWLNGMAGTGKSTIARTVAASFSRNDNSLGASFFFKRGEADRANAIRLFPTIVRQLAIIIPQILPRVQKIVQDNPGIVAKTMREQFNKLLLGPLLTLEVSGSIRTLIIVIDALDECEPDNDIRLILELLPQLQKVGSIRLRVFLTSRPELALKLGFSRIADDHTDIVLHNIPKEDIERDISLFFEHQLSEIRTERYLPDDWPGETNIQKLVTLSIPLFISAATICRVLNDPFWDPLDSLAEILAHQNDASQLAGMYLPVLNRLLRGQNGKQKDKLIHDFRQIVGAIVVLESPLSVASLSKLLNIQERHIYLRLSPLHSVLSVPEGILPVRLLHLSFRDFLLAPETHETPFGIDEKVKHYDLTLKCFSACQNLRKNICGLPSDATKRTEIDSQATIHLSQDLQYACRYWVNHLSKCTEMEDILTNALSFLRCHFLHWVEVMSILGLISEVIGAIQILQKATGNKNSEIAEFLHDAKRFVLKNRHIAEEAPLQLYCSGIIFAPRSSVIRRQFLESPEFSRDLPTWISRLPQVDENWSAGLQVLEGHSGKVNSVAFSPNGQLLASGSDDNTVRLWEAATGTLLHILSGHSTGVTSMAFSPSSQLLVSSSSDNKILLWETKTGTMQQTIESHSNGALVRSLAISHNGRMLAIGFQSGTASVRDIATGTLLQTLDGRGLASSVAFSPDDSLLAIGSTTIEFRSSYEEIQSIQRSIQLWDITTSDLRQVLKYEYKPGYPVNVWLDDHLSDSDYALNPRLRNSTSGDLWQSFASNSWDIAVAAFSSECRLLAFSVREKLAYVWDTTTGTLQRTLEGHSYDIYSMAFSPDGRLLASGSEDSTVRLWDITTNTLQHNTVGHSDCIRGPAYQNRDTRSLEQTSQDHGESTMSVAFSSNGRFLASGSGDSVIRLWNVKTGTVLMIISRSSWAQSMVFSSDNGMLAAVSRDTIEIWDIMVGGLLQTLRKNPSDSWRIAHLLSFSPDDRLLAVGSQSTITLWDIPAGKVLRRLEGYTEYAEGSVTFSADGRLLAYSSYDWTIRLWDITTGVLRQKVPFIGMAKHLEFSEDGLFLYSNRGSLDIRSKHFDDTSCLSDPKISIVEKQWIALNGTGALWLPPEYRPSCSAVKDNLLVLGHKSGRGVSFIEFRV